MYICTENERQEGMLRTWGAPYTFGTPRKVMCHACFYTGLLCRRSPSLLITQISFSVELRLPLEESLNFCICSVMYFFVIDSEFGTRTISSAPCLDAFSIALLIVLAPALLMVLISIIACSANPSVLLKPSTYDWSGMRNTR